MYLKVKDRFVPILSQTLGLNIDETQADLKVTLPFFSKKMKKGKVDVETIFNLEFHVFLFYFSNLVFQPDYLHLAN